MQYTEEMKIGVPHVDSQHKEMIDFANKAASLYLTNPSKEEMEECLNFLGNYVVQHFRDEEKLQIESNYPRYQQHKQIHQEFVDTFNSLYTEYQKNGPSEELSVALTNKISSWIITHIKKEDINFGKHYTKAKLARLKTYVKNDNDEMENMYLNFNVGEEVYGIEIRQVLQIIGMQEITEMPEMPPGMKGFIDLRGNVIPVVSMRLRLGKTENGYSDRTCIVVVQVGEKEIGLIVDAIQETITIEPESISPPPTTGEGMDNPYIMGVARLPNDRVAVLIHVQQLFAG